MIGHQEFKEGFARAQNFFRIGDDFHAGLDRPDAGGGENASAGIHYAETADAHGGLILQMAKRGNVDAVHARGIENASASGYANGLTVESDVDHSGWCGGGCHFKVTSSQFSVRRERNFFRFSSHLDIVASPFQFSVFCKNEKNKYELYFDWRSSGRCFLSLLHRGSFSN
jgi:hypothetical protein